MFNRGEFLIHTDSAGLREHITGSLRNHVILRRARDMEDLALRLRAVGRWAGVVLALEVLRDLGPALKQLRRLRYAEPHIPMLVLLEECPDGLLNRLHAMHFEAVTLPVDPDNLISFAQRAMTAGWLPDEGLARVVNQLAESHALTGREVQLLTMTLGNMPRGRMRRRLGITDNTLKSQVRQLLRKCGERSLDGLAKNVLRVAWLQRCVPRSTDESPAPWCAWRPTSRGTSTGLMCV